MASIVSCLDPQRVVNRYTKEVITVPCGRCSACLNKKAATMVQRLDQERYCWKYAAFLTLTYDDKHLPILQVTDRSLFDVDPKRHHPILHSINFDRFDFYYEKCKQFDSDTLKEKIRQSEDYIKLCNQHFGGLPYICTVDVQKFLKRLRIMIKRSYKHDLTDKQLNDEKSQSFRYYCAFEYGPTTLRPHCHFILFFNSEYISAHLEEFVSETWRYGTHDLSYVWDTNSKYVAKYLNSCSHLPIIYLHNRLRPTALYSKHPALGSLIYSSEKLKEMFLEKTCEQSILDHSTNLFDNVPLWRSLQDKLYPRLTGFSKLTPKHRIRLYEIPCNDDYSFKEFSKYVTESNASYIKDYIEYLKSIDGELDKKLLYWYSIGKRMYWQAVSWNLPIHLYCQTVASFHADLDGKKLRDYYQLVQTSIDDGKISAKCLLQFDKEFFDTRRDMNLGDLEMYEIEYFRSFQGLDLEKFFSDDLSVRLPYQEQFIVENSLYYRQFKTRNEKIHNDSYKTKRKNDYITSEIDPFYKELYVLLSTFNY